MAAWPAAPPAFSYLFVDAFYSDFANANCWLGQTAAQGCSNGTIQNRTGQTLEAAPKHRVIFSGRYEGQDTLIAGLRHFAQANYRWRSRTNVSSNGDPRGVQDAFGILDLSAGLISADDAWMLSFFTKDAGGRCELSTGRAASGTSGRDESRMDSFRASLRAKGDTLYAIYASLI